MFETGKSLKIVLTAVCTLISAALHAQTAGATAPKLHIFTNVSGVGTTGRITKWTDTTGTLADSIISETTGSQIFVGFPNSDSPIVANPPTATPNKLHVFSTNNADGLSVDGTQNPAVTFRNNGTVKGFIGLATASTAWFSNTASGDVIVRSESGNVLLGHFVSGGAAPLVVTSSNVGIGMTPQLTLDVRGTALAYGPDRRVMRLWDDSDKECPTCTIAGVGGGLDFAGRYSTTDASLYTQYANIKGVKANSTSGDFAGRFSVSIDNSSGSMIERVSVDSTGTTLTGNLTTNGNITATGSITGATVINAVYQDVAEWVPATVHMEPGTVVVLNRQHKNQVMPSEQAYDTAVAGVVSEQPGVVLGVASDSKAQIATTGRVKVHVDATAGAISIGDLLVTSNKPGTAMKSQPVDLGGVQFHRPGTVIGKALEPMPNGQGEILVLLSLQ